MELCYKVDKKCLEGRRYEDFIRYLGENPETNVVEMDTVSGRPGTDDRCLLTIHMVSSSFMLVISRERNDSASVTAAIDSICEAIGLDNFRKLFPVILTDNGSEFSDPRAIEVDPATGSMRSRVFYCHPYAFFEKGECEVNHKYIRRIIPKGTPLVIGQRGANIMMSHINSSEREIHGGRSPYELLEHKGFGDVLTRLGISKIDPKDIVLTPELVKDITD